MPAPIDLRNVAAGQGGFVIHGEEAGDAIGGRCASAGDLNGDGFDDLIIGAPLADGPGNTRPAAGAAYVVFGQAGGFGTAIDLAEIAAGLGGFVIQGEDTVDYAGRSVAAAGDLNGDGCGDLIIGAYRADGPGNGRNWAGDSYVVFGKAGGFAPAIDLRDVAAGQGGFVIHGEDAGDWSGFAIAPAGDINGDGFDDLIIGARYADGPGNARGNAGASYVVFGQAGSFAAGIDLRNVAAGQGGFVIQGEDAADQSGYAVAAAGDINGDGFDDLIIGAREADGPGNTRLDAGGGYVVFGKPGGFGSAIDLRDIATGQGGFVIQGEERYDYAGTSVASAGDINADGFDDLFIGAFAADGPGNARSRAGAGYVVFGKAGGFAPAIDLADIATGQGGFVIHGEDGGVSFPFGDYAGLSLASAGDLNGDGFGDLIIGAYAADGPGNTRIRAGAGYVIFGKAGGFGTAIDLRDITAGQGGFVIHGEEGNDGAGLPVAGAGDLNGDGFDDLFIGARGADGPGNTRSGAGAGYVIFGGAFTPGPAGTDGDDSLTGGAGVQGIEGLAGNDTLRGGGGNDTLAGGAGDDVIGGGAGADVLSGGAGADRFAFGDNTLGATDRILDFSRAEGDYINLAGVDADAGTAGDDAFAFIGTTAFSGTAGELRAAAAQGGTVLRIEGDVDGDGVADLTIDILTDATAKIGWFVL